MMTDVVPYCFTDYASSDTSFTFFSTKRLHIKVQGSKESTLNPSDGHYDSRKSETMSLLFITTGLFSWVKSEIRFQTAFTNRGRERRRWFLRGKEILSHDLSITPSANDCVCSSLLNAMLILSYL